MIAAVSDTVLGPVTLRGECLRSYMGLLRPLCHMLKHGLIKL